MSNSNHNTQNPILNIYNPSALYDPIPYGYSHIAEVKNFSRIIHIAGQGGENIHGVCPVDFNQQLINAFHHIEIALKHRTAQFSDIAILRILIVKHDSQKHQLLIHEMNRIWKDKKFPACTLIPVPCLATTDMLIEIEATAYCA